MTNQVLNLVMDFSCLVSLHRKLIKTVDLYGRVFGVLPTRTDFLDNCTGVGSLIFSVGQRVLRFLFVGGDLFIM